MKNESRVKLFMGALTLILQNAPIRSFRNGFQLQQNKKNKIWEHFSYPNLVPLCSNDKTSRYSTNLRISINRKSVTLRLSEDDQADIHQNFQKQNYQKQNRNEISRKEFVSALVLSTLANESASLQPVKAVENNNDQIKPLSTVQPPITISSTTGKKRNKSLEEGISGMVAGSSLTVTKTLVKYPLDTATVRLQMPSTTYTIFNIPQLFKNSFRGISVPLLTNIPAGAIFFAVKDSTKSLLKESRIFPDNSKWLITAAAVAVAQFPYWLVRNPSEVVKTRQQAGIEGYGEGVNAWAAFQNVYRQSLEEQQLTKESGSSEKTPPMSALDAFYAGYGENILYAFPADVIKFVAYDVLTTRARNNNRGGKSSLSPLESAIAGAFATAIAQFITTPLDVVRNRVMMKNDMSSQREDISNRNKNEQDNNYSDSSTSYVQTLVLLAQKEGIPGLFAGVSPRVGKALLSGAIQFATYEETKASIAALFDKKS